MVSVEAGIAQGQRKVKCDAREVEKEEWNDTHKVIIESEVNRWIEPTASQSQMNEGPYSWTPGLGLKYNYSFSGPWLYKLFPALVYLHMLSSQIKPGQGGQDGVLRLEAWLCRVADCERHLETLQPTDHCWASMGYVFAVQQPSGTDRTASLLTGDTQNTPPPPPTSPDWLSSLWGAREDKERNGCIEHWGETKDRGRKRET